MHVKYLLHMWKQFFELALLLIVVLIVTGVIAQT